MPGGLIFDADCTAAGIIRQQGPFAVLVDPERRDQALDSALLASWQHLRERGTAYLRPGAIRDRLARLRLEGKGAGIAGLELADLVVFPIGRFVAGKQPREDWAIVESKLRRRKGDYLGAGLVVLPKESGRGPLRSTRPGSV